MTNFTNGSLVFLLWKFDGSGGVVGKFQYRCDAEAFAGMKCADDAAKRPTDASKWFYLVVCEAENFAKSFEPIKSKPSADD